MKHHEIEAERQKIRDRIQRASASPKAVLTPPLPSPTLHDSHIKRVAAYTRVSTTNIEQVSSIENQTKYYTDVVAKHPEWELYRIYSDEGKSGTSRKQRTEFNEMLQDAIDQKFDVILCASVSRFARNVKDFLQVIKNLKNQNPMHPVGVYFETENSYTLNPDSENILDMHAMFAAWESRNKSLRMILSYDQRICTGQYPVADLLGYRHTKDGQLIIHEEEAKTVRYIYLAYISGYTFTEIANVLTEKQRSTLKGRTDWNAAMARAIVQNERRWGDLKARKRIVIDFEEHKTIKNEGAKRRYAAFVPEHHEPIVTRDIAKAVQIVSRSNSGLGKGIHELAVISDGMLKGFVSIFPNWSAINNDILTFISMNVYADDSDEQPFSAHSTDTEDAWMPCGRMLINTNTLSMRISNKRLKLNRKALDVLKDWEYIELLYHPIYKIICIRSSDQTAKNAFSLRKTNDNFIQEIPAASLCAIIQEALGESDTVMVRGIARTRDNAAVIFFYLDESYRDILNDVSSEDILQKSVFVENPLVGNLPSRAEVLREVDELLLSM